MIIKKMALPRRTFLRGVGATVALPLLDAMVPALSAIKDCRCTRKATWLHLSAKRGRDAVVDAEGGGD